MSRRKLKEECQWMISSMGDSSLSPCCVIELGWCCSWICSTVMHCLSWVIRSSGIESCLAAAGLKARAGAAGCCQWWAPKVVPAWSGCPHVSHRLGAPDLFPFPVASDAVMLQVKCFTLPLTVLHYIIFYWDYFLQELSAGFFQSSD